MAMEKTQRNLEMLEKFRNGATTPDLAKYYGISDVRVNFLLKKTGLSRDERRIIEFWRLVIKTDNPDECWIWTGQENHRYGKIMINRKVIKATHFSYFLATGKMPDNCILHSCDNPPCVNPKHLRDGTKPENTKECIEKGRAAWQVDIGKFRQSIRKAVRQTSPLLRLTRDSAALAKMKLRNGDGATKIARDLNVSRGCILGIQQGRTWVDVN